MDPATSLKTPNPNPNPNPNVYQVGGVPVEFPYKPYGSQLAFMGRVIYTFDRAQRQEHCHALLESPTGTGKTLSLLCSSLAWQQQQHQRIQKSKNPLQIPLPNPSPPPVPTPQPTPDPLLHGGGFIPEPDPSGNLEQPPLVTSNPNRAQKKQMAPTIYYASRTHSQITQVIREYRKTSYRVPMAVLASRKRYCTNKSVNVKVNVDEECKFLLKDTSVNCLEFKNAHKVKGHPSLQKGGCHEVHDIEDLVRVGRTVKGCSYFAAQTMAAEAQLVFCPYSYIINPTVRRAMDIDIKGAIVILDEAHNIEDMARDAGSLDVEEEVLYTLQTELGQLCMNESVATIYQPLYDMIQGIISWIGDRKDRLEKREFERYSSYWTGDKATRELQEAGVSQQFFPLLEECAKKAIKAASDSESDGVHLSGISAITLEGLFSSLGYFFSRNGRHTLDYQLALQRYVKRDGSNASSGWTYSMNLWCLNPAVVFREIADLSLSVILTSGTLSPMGSFSSELGVKFEACMEAPHVIDVESQLWAAVISSGPGDCQLNASYKTADGYAFQDALGASLEEICKVVPGGALVFFPSYKLLEKLRVRWCQTGQWSRLNAQKPIYVEPRGNVEDFEPVLKGYYNSIRGSNRIAQGKTRSGLKRGLKHPSMESRRDPIKGGAAFLAVCRGKVSEGIDFSDENARVVVIVGIPFPNKNDIQVVLKKKYNDTYKSSRGLLSGSEWYCHQAFRALNQAAGRCIRHRLDYGAIVLLDERFKEERNLAYVSKWLRKSLKQYDSFDKSLEELRTFFLDVEKRPSHRSKDALQTELVISDFNEEKPPSSKQNKIIPQKISQKLSKLNSQNGRKRVPEKTLSIAKTNPLAKAFSPAFKDNAPLSQLKSEGSRVVKALGGTNEKPLNSCPEKDDPDCTILKYSRWSETFSMTSSCNTSDQSLLIENTAIGDNIASPSVLSKSGNSCSTVVQTCNQFPDRPSFLSLSTTNNSNLSEGLCTLTGTPEREKFDLCSPVKESPLNMSVNSHNQKKRKLMDSFLGSCTRMHHFSSPDPESFCQVDPISSRSVSKDTNERNEFDANYSRHKNQNSSVQERFMVKTDSTLDLLSDNSIKTKLHICCSVCRCPLGLCENDFLVACSLTSSPKIYLAYVLENGPTSIWPPECLSRIQETSVRIVICDVSSIDQRILNRCTKEGAQPGIWSEEDGCVFRIVSCPFCTVSKTCLGLEIMATDASNIHLLNKVLLYADHLYVKNEETPKEEAILPICTPGINRGSGFSQIEKYAYTQQKDSKSLSTTKSKLRLPKREQVSSSQDQGAVHI